MIHKDYLEEILQNFSGKVRDALREIIEGNNSDGCEQAEQAIAQLLELNPSFALSLDPTSLVMMLKLNGVGYSVAHYVGYTLNLLSEVYARLENVPLSELRLAQAQALAQNFDFDVQECPVEFKDAVETLKLSKE